MANPDEVAFPFGLADDTLDIPQSHPPDPRQQGPLVGVWREPGIEKHAVAVTTRHLLEREGDQVSEAPFGQRVLAGKKRS